jgi:hypothetical protein
MPCLRNMHNWTVTSRGPGVRKSWVCETCGTRAARDAAGITTYDYADNPNDVNTHPAVVDVDFTE